MAICPVCGREYSAPPAISRADNKTEICPVCGSREAVEAFRAAKDSIGKETANAVIKEIEEAEIASGRVEPLVTQSDQATPTETP